MTGGPCAVKLAITWANRRVHLNTVLDWLPLNRCVYLKAMYENEHLNPALSPFCYRKVRRGGNAPSVIRNHAT